MAKQGYFKNIAKAVLEPVVKSLYDGAPNYGIGMSMLLGRSFTWGLNSDAAYLNKIYYSATNILVGKLIEAPIIFSKKKPTSSSKFDRFYSKSITNEQRFALKKLSLIEVDDSHELVKLFNNPNKYQTGKELTEDFWHNYCAGDGFMFFEPFDIGLSRNRKPIAIHSLKRDRVTVIRSYDTYDNILEYRYTAWDGKWITIPKEYMLHLKHYNPNLGDLKGLGVDVVASMDISLNNANNEMQGSAFRNGGRSTLISSKSEVTDGEVINKMTSEQMSALKETVLRDYQGVENYRKTHFTNGETVVQSYGDTLVETEAINAEDSQWKNIFTICGVPWVLSPAASTVSENTVITGFKSLVTNTVMPIIRKFDQKLNQKIYQWWPDIIAAHDVTEFSELAPDLKLMKEVYGSPLLRTDETRAIFGYDELGGEEGSAILVASGLMPLQDLLSSFEVDDTAEEM